MPGRWKATPTTSLISTSSIRWHVSLASIEHLTALVMAEVYATNYDFKLIDI
jgi:hypothetical protein